MSADIIQTIHADVLSLSRDYGLPYEPLAHSTLNEKLNILHGVTYATNDEYPKAQYLAIGNGGHTGITGNIGSIETDYKRHGIKDAALFSQMPVRLAEVNNGSDSLTAQERAKYRLKKQATHGGVLYNEYYLLKTDNAITEQPTVEIVETNNGQVVSRTPFVPTQAMLSPQPLTTNTVNQAQQTYINVYIPFEFTLDRTDINHIIDAQSIITGSTSSAVISEVALCSGQEVANTEASYPEVGKVIIVDHIPEISALRRNRNNMTLSFRIGRTSLNLV